LTPSLSYGKIVTFILMLPIPLFTFFLTRKFFVIGNISAYILS